MSYLGYAKSISEHILKITNHPKVLEIGIDTGQTAIPLIHNMSILCDAFLYVGIDIKIKKEFTEQILQMSNVCIDGFDDLSGRDVIVFHENSLEWLEKNKNSKLQFDVIFIDGDHNYYTVSNELQLCQSLIKPSTLIICDDYRGRWSEKDLFYAENDAYKNNEIATKRVQTKKIGVKSAVDDFVGKHKEDWGIVESAKIGDPCFLYQKKYYKFDVVEIEHDVTKIGSLSRTHKLLFELL